MPRTVLFRNHQNRTRKWFRQTCQKKISACDYLSFFCQEAIKGTVSYNDVASKSASEVDTSPSRQAYFYRTSTEAVEFFKRILVAVMKNRGALSEKETDIKKLNQRFKRILVQDSTIIRLPSKLYEIFSGSKNATTTVCNARIQGVYDLISCSFTSFSIDTYSENDLSVADKIEVMEGDLVLRDRGYFVKSSIENLKRKGADSISRYKHKTAFYAPHSKTAINLLELLQKQGSIDIMVVPEVDSNFTLRILAAPVSEEIANIRRMKARKEAKNGCSHELLQLLGWNIFITTIDAQEFTVKQVYLIYSLRWRIECIFKTWKSDLKFDKIHNVGENQLRVILYARFIMLTLLYERAYNPLQKTVLEKHNKQISLLKTIHYLSRNLIRFVELFFDISRCALAINIIARYCSYEKRKRQTYVDVFNSVLLY